MPQADGEILGWIWLAAGAGGYLLGSIPFGLLLTRLAGLGDIRTIGSGNIGATNVLRTGNKALSGLTLLLDAGKGAGAAALALPWGVGAALAAGAGAVLGHLFPVWLGFRGGKGVATALGALLVLAWPVGLLACATWAAAALVLRYSSLAAITAFVAAPFYAWWLSDEARTGFAAALAVLVVARHHANIRRLMRGEEPRIGR